MNESSQNLISIKLNHSFNCTYCVSLVSSKTVQRQDLTPFGTQGIF